MTKAAMRQDEVANTLLRSFSAADFALIAPHLSRRTVSVNEAIASTADAIDALVFPEAGVAALLDRLQGDRRLAVALVGREGFVGWPLLLGDGRWPHDVVMRADAGDVLVLPAATLPRLLAASETLRRRLLQFVGIVMVQMGCTIVSSMAHSVERRMARWILLYQDRLGGDDIYLTHEEFRVMLGVRRSSITEALHRLEASQAVRGLRGRVVVRDRARLADLAGDTHGPAEALYEQLILGRG